MDPSTLKTLVTLLEPEACEELEGTRLELLLVGGKLPPHEGGQNISFELDAEKIALAIAILGVLQPPVKWFFEKLKEKRKTKLDIRKELRSAFKDNKLVLNSLSSAQGRLIIAYLQGMEDRRD